MLQKKLLYSLCSALVILSACHKNDPTPNPGVDLSLTAAEQQKVSNDNAFSLKLLKTVSATSPNTANLMISPLSVSFAMGMVSNGANGQTLTDINSTMLFNGFSQDQVNTYYNKLITGLPAVDPATTLKVANSIWYNQHFSVTPQFLQTNNALYQAKVQSADFSSSSTKDAINNWVSDQTNGKISKIVNGIPSNVLMYLINTIYFKSTWDSRFDPASTHQQTFYPANGLTVQTDFMNGKATYNSYFDNDVHISELLYNNKKYSMVIIMPVNNASVQSVISTLDSLKWNSWMTQLRTTTGQLSLPKFKFGYGLSLSGALISMGMSNAFSPAADFTRINPAGGLQITDVQHQTFIEVNEEGTEAAAVTSVVMGVTAVAPSYNLIDHPFIFAIREMKTGLILFTGIVNNPLLTGQ